MAKRASSLGKVLLAIYLLLTGLVQLINLNFTGLPLILALLAIVTGVLLLLDR